MRQIIETRRDALEMIHCGLVSDTAIREAVIHLDVDFVLDSLEREATDGQMDEIVRLVGNYINSQDQSVNEAIAEIAEQVLGEMGET